MFASVLLASRLDTNYYVCLLMLTSVFLFALFPIFSRILSKRWEYYNTVLSVSLNLVCFVLNDWQSNILYIAAILFINVIGPFWLIKIQKYKNEIKGPWDEATIN